MKRILAVLSFSLLLSLAKKFQYGINRTFLISGIIDYVYYKEENTITLQNLTHDYNPIVELSFSYDYTNLDFCITKSKIYIDDYLLTKGNCSIQKYFLYLYYSF